MRKIIIGIHGLGNKPPENILKTWWKKSLKEGLLRIGSSRTQFKFVLVYWAHLLHEKPLDLKIKDKHHPLFIEDPYIPRKKDFVSEKPSEWKKKLLNNIEEKLDDIFYNEDSFINFEKIADLVIRNFFQDLAVYFGAKPEDKQIDLHDIRKKIRNVLAVSLKKYQNYEILLVAHSMGSIVAYDVLSQNSSTLKINTLVTIGSPLGLPVIVKRILQEQNQDPKMDHCPATPENIQKKWYNFADIEDKVTINYTLADDYKKNSAGIGPVDSLVDNDYEYDGTQNPHKAYGYLRTPEVAEVIHQFLAPEKETFLQVFRNKLFSLPGVFRKKMNAFKSQK